MFLITSIKSLLDKLLFAGLLLLGIQVPNFVAQYQLVLAAHYQESSQQLQAYQQLADRFYAGDIHRLVQAHKDNHEASIRAEADIISTLIQRHEGLEKQYQALHQQPLTAQLQQLVRIVDFTLVDEVIEHYSINLPLNTQAITVGLMLALLIHFLIYGVWGLIVMLCRTRPQQTQTSRA